MPDIYVRLKEAGAWWLINLEHSGEYGSNSRMIGFKTEVQNYPRFNRLLKASIKLKETTVKKRAAKTALQEQVPTKVISTRF